MSASFEFTPQATEDLDAIWWFIARDSRESADRVEMEIVATCRRLAKHPLMGSKRQDITSLPVCFWTVTKFPNYVIVYRPNDSASSRRRDARQAGPETGSGKAPLTRVGLIGA
jgi:plasmid stabilization system protein ParE